MGISLGELENSIKRPPGPHVVVFPYPMQGHINPLMEFAKRLVFHNLNVKERMAQAQDGKSALENIY
ncbi:hypothetical protein SUGI_0487100 [Cryptomeria japonica]|nr:hypothetical protein SUGI_0487100 [Cryptomeria japonica]